VLKLRFCSFSETEQPPSTGTQALNFEVAKSKFAACRASCIAAVVVTLPGRRINKGANR